MIVIFLLPQRLTKRTFVGTTIKYFFVGNLVKLIPYCTEGLMTGKNVGTSLVLVPCVAVGAALGVWLNRKFSDRAFRLVVYLLALAFGLFLLSGW